MEQKELFDRVDDAVCAVRSALEEGILPGAGKALFEESFLDGLEGETEEHFAARMIMNEALKAPFFQILSNAGLNLIDDYPLNGAGPGEGLNIKTREYGDLIKMGVIDPLKVTRSALQNAVSVAVTILSTNAIITLARSYEVAQD